MSKEDSLKKIPALVSVLYVTVLINIDTIREYFLFPRGGLCLLYLQWVYAVTTNT